jgi:hypothetical protein
MEVRDQGEPATSGAPGCKKSFDQNPEKYVMGAGTHGEHGHHGHGHH